MVNKTSREESNKFLSHTKNSCSFNSISRLRKTIFSQTPNRVLLISTKKWGLCENKEVLQNQRQFLQRVTTSRRKWRERGNFRRDLPALFTWGALQGKSQTDSTKRASLQFIRQNLAIKGNTSQFWRDLVQDLAPHKTCSRTRMRNLKTVRV